MTEQTSTKEQPYAMGRQTVRKARTDLTSKDFEASIIPVNPVKPTLRIIFGLQSENSANRYFINRGRIWPRNGHIRMF